MALQIISVVLFTVSFSEALTLRCYNCTTPVPPGTCTQNTSCTPREQCSSFTTTYNLPDTIMCYICNDLNCTNTQKLLCKGEESQCISATAELVGSNTTTILKGCASKNVCGNSTILPQLVRQWANVRNVPCCDGNLCNSVRSLTQGAVLLLVPILTVLFSI